MNIKALIWQENDLWCGCILALLGCHTWAKTEIELVTMLEVASQDTSNAASLDANLDVKLIELSL